MEMLEIADESMENIYILDIQFLHQFPESIDIDQFFDSTHHFPQKDPSFRKSPVYFGLTKLLSQSSARFWNRRIRYQKNNYRVKHL